MRRRIGLAIVLAACASSRDRPPSPSGNGIDHVTMAVERTEDHGGGWYLRLDFRYRVPAMDDLTKLTLQARVACQVGAERRVEVDADYPLMPWRRRIDTGSPGRVSLRPFEQAPLPAAPSACDLEIAEARQNPGPFATLIALCARPGHAPIEPGPCR